jgi:hypothetical protein
VSHSHLHRWLLLIAVISHNGRIELRVLLKLATWWQFCIGSTGTATYLLVFRTSSLLVFLAVNILFAVLEIFHDYFLFFNLLESLRATIITALFTILRVWASPILCNFHSFQSSRLFLSLNFLKLQLLYILDLLFLFLREWLLVRLFRSFQEFLVDFNPKWFLNDKIICRKMSVKSTL